MPRDGSNIYSQPFPDVVEDTTIESTVYNGFTNDVAADLNAARPIVAGGTGATNADQALFNLAAEKSTQTVTNYDSHLWVPGSFRSAAAAPGAQNATAAFSGTCYIQEALANPPTNQNVTVEARDTTSGTLYIRTKTAGTWSAWTKEHATVFDALGYNGLQINGSMDIDQELNSALRTTAGYVCDGWRVGWGGTMALRANSGGGAQFVSVGFPNYIYVNPTTAQTTLGSSDYTQVYQRIEDARTARLAWGTAGAQSISIGFWVCHHRTGTYSGVVRNAANDRAYAFTYTQDVADTAEYKTVTIPGCTTGVWPTGTNSTSIEVAFSFGCGETLTAPSADTWLNNNYIAGPGQVNAVASTADVFRLTGVCVLPGSEAPDASHSALIMRPYDQEIITCLRYYEKINGSIGSGSAFATNGFSIALPYYRKRGTPAITAVVPTGLRVGNATGTGVAITTFDGASPISNTGAICNFSVASGLVAGNGAALWVPLASATTFMVMDARL